MKKITAIVKTRYRKNSDSSFSCDIELGIEANIEGYLDSAMGHDGTTKLLGETLSKEWGTLLGGLRKKTVTISDFDVASLKNRVKEFVEYQIGEVLEKDTKQYQQSLCPPEETFRIFKFDY